MTRNRIVKIIKNRQKLQLAPEWTIPEVCSLTDRKSLSHSIAIVVANMTVMLSMKRAMTDKAGQSQKNIEQLEQNEAGANVLIVQTNVNIFMSMVTDAKEL